jgi:hypothetical protein
MTDPIQQFIQAERRALAQSAPQPHAAQAWQRLRLQRAARLERLMNRAGWTTRVLIAVAAAVTAFVSPRDLGAIALIAVLVAWLSNGACASLRRADPRQPLSRSFDREDSSHA